MQVEEFSLILFFKIEIEFTYHRINHENGGLVVY